MADSRETKGIRQAVNLAETAYIGALSRDPKFRQAEGLHPFVLALRKADIGAKRLIVEAKYKWRKIAQRLEPTDVVLTAAGALTGAISAPRYKGVSGVVEGAFSGAIMGMTASELVNNIKRRT